MFEVICTVTGEQYAICETGAVAQEHARFLRERFPDAYMHPLRVRPLKVDWRAREAKRLEDGTYHPLPDWWLESDWWRVACENNPALKDHFPHRAKDLDRVAFTADEQRGTLDKQTVINADTYLARYCPNLTPQQVGKFAAAFVGTQEYVLKISFKKSDFVFAYESQSVTAEGGTSPSCMMHATSDFDYDLPEHPAAVYSTTEAEYSPTSEPPPNALAIAYFTDPEDDDCVLARSIVWPAKQGYLRLYGKRPTHVDILRALLEDAGFYKIRDIAGARLAIIPVNNYKYLMPYIDGGCQTVDDDGEYFTVRRYARYTATSTDGYISMREEEEEDERTECCPNCGDYFHPDDMRLIVNRDEFWCIHCAQHDATHLPSVRNLFSTRYWDLSDEGVAVIEIWFPNISSSHFQRMVVTNEDWEDNYVYECHFSGKVVRTEDDPPAIVTDEFGDEYKLSPKAYAYGLIPPTHVVKNEDGSYSFAQPMLPLVVAAAVAATEGSNE